MTVPAGTARATESGLRRPSAGRSPPGVPPRHSRQRPNATAQLQLRTSWDGTSQAQRYPLPAVTSAAGSPQTGRHAGRAFYPEPPGSGGDEPRPRNRTRPCRPASPAGVPYGSEMGRK